MLIKFSKFVRVYNEMLVKDGFSHNLGNWLKVQLNGFLHLCELAVALKLFKTIELLQL